MLLSYALLDGLQDKLVPTLVELVFGRAIGVVVWRWNRASYNGALSQLSGYKHTICGMPASMFSHATCDFNAPILFISNTKIQILELCADNFSGGS